MPRFSRKAGVSGVYHVVVRGINKEMLFVDDDDDLYFLHLISKYKNECDFKVLAFCLMSNHAHLLIRIRDGLPGDIMQKILLSYSHYFNLKYERSGHLFQNRYFSAPVDNEAYLINVLKYIVYNPVEAKIVAKPMDYRWSSISEFYGMESSITDTEEIISLFPDKASLYTLLEQELSSDEEQTIILPKTVVTDKEVYEMAKKMSGCSTAREYRGLSKEDRAKFVSALRAKGIPVRQISRVTGISKSVIGAIR